MALHACPECKRDVSDKALACPNCGRPMRAGAGSRSNLLLAGAALAGVALGGGGVALALGPRPSDYSRVEQLRAQEDEGGAHDEHVRQRFFRLYKGNPGNAMYIYLWGRLEDDPAEQLKLAQDGIRADEHFSWNYNIAARALARQGHIEEAYAEAQKGEALDTGNLELAEKVNTLKAMLDHKLQGEKPPAPSGGGGGAPAQYTGFLKGTIHSPDRADLQAIHATRPAESREATEEGVRGFVVCSNPYTDACVHVFVARDARFKGTWAPPSVDLGAQKDRALVTVTGASVDNGKGENILLADAIAEGAK